MFSLMAPRPPQGTTSRSGPAARNQKITAAHSRDAHSLPSGRHTTAPTVEKTHRLAGDVDGRVDPACCSQLHVIYARAPCRRRHLPPPRLLPAAAAAHHLPCCVLPPPSSTSPHTWAIHPCMLAANAHRAVPACLYEQRDGPHTLGTLTLRSRVSTMSNCKWAQGASSWVSKVGTRSRTLSLLLA